MAFISELHVRSNVLTKVLEMQLATHSLNESSSLAPANRARAFIWTVVIAALTCLPLSSSASPVILQDTRGDAVARRTDTGADGPTGEGAHQLPDLVSISVGAWSPNSPQADLFTGLWSPSGTFFRLELVFDGVVNPPGPCGCCGDAAFEPFRYGPNPVSGYIEINVDPAADTGGELEWPDLRYLGNTSRFGGLPQPASAGERAAVDARAFDGDLESAPFVERTGEDFHLELVGWEIASDQIQRSDPDDWLFGPGETWVVSGHLFHRAHGYTQFSSACCRAGRPIGSYEPLVEVQFSHHVMSDRTVVSLVYPLTQAAAAAMASSAPEPMDVMFTNQNSVTEALWELKISAMIATTADRAMPEFALIAPWETADPDTCLDPSSWQIGALVGGSYTTPQDSLFVWSDICPNVLVGDCDGNGAVDSADIELFDAYLSANDGNPAIDEDGAVNGSIEILNFGPGFSLYDLNYDGLIDGDDRAMLGGPVRPRGDFDFDGDVDQSDFGHMQACWSGSEPPAPACRNADLNHDNRIDQDDIASFVGCMSGPAIPADPNCGRP